LSKELRAADKIISPASSDLERHNEDDVLLKAAHPKVHKHLILCCAFVYLTMRLYVSNVSYSAIINLESGEGMRSQIGKTSSLQRA
jgi:hypothetical protein